MLQFHDGIVAPSNYTELSRRWIMNVSGVSDRSTVNLLELYRTQASNSVLASDDGATTSLGVTGLAGAGDVDFSQPAVLFSKLQQLQTSDPEKFKEVCSHIADELKSASEEQGDGFGSRMLADLAEKFQNVAEGGDLSQLQPPEPGHRPPPGGARQEEGDVSQQPPEPPNFGQIPGVYAQYAQQDSMSLVELLQNQGNQGNTHSGLEQLMSSLIDEVDQALSS
jgi:hypothetical protein